MIYRRSLVSFDNFVYGFSPETENREGDEYMVDFGRIGWEYIVDFGKSKSWIEDFNKSNYRSRRFKTRKEAESFLDRLHKFNFKDGDYPEHNLIGWTHIYSRRII
jgi:hypothetical protein